MTITKVTHDLLDDITDSVADALSGLTLSTTVAVADIMPFYDQSASAWRKATVANIVSSDAISGGGGLLKVSSDDLDMDNHNISNVNHLTFNDTGANEGIEWLGGNGWRIVESTDSLSSSSGAGNIQFVKGSTRVMTLTTDGVLKLPEGGLNVSGDVDFDNGTSTQVDVKCDNDGMAEIRLYGTSQGTGRVFVGQSTTYGGGIEYNGDNNPATTGAGSDHVTLYRKYSGGDFWTAKNAVTNNDWDFRGSVTTSASDERLKENITCITDALEKVSRLRGVTFDWRDDVVAKGFVPSMKHETGVIAQEVQKVIPDAAVPAPFDKEYLTVQHEKIIPVLIEAIKELHRDVEQLQLIANQNCQKKNISVER